MTKQDNDKATDSNTGDTTYQRTYKGAECKVSGSDAGGWTVSVDGDSLGNVPSLTAAAKATMAHVRGCELGDVPSTNGRRFYDAPAGGGGSTGSSRSNSSGKVKAGKAKVNLYSVIATLASIAKVDLSDEGKVDALCFGHDNDGGDTAATTTKEAIDAALIREQSKLNAAAQAKRDATAKARAAKQQGSALKKMRSARDAMAAIGQDTSALDAAIAAMQDATPDNDSN
jgi:hypothetical protein